MDKVVNVVMKEIRERRSQLSEALAAGSAKDYAEYKYLCGEIRGLSAVEMYLSDLAKNLEQIDE